MGLREDILNETVSQIPMREAITVPVGTTLNQVIERMRQTKLGCVFVVDPAGRPLGKFTERQVLRLVSACVPLDQTVGEHMVTIPQSGCVRLNDPVVRVLQNMRQTRLRFLCVVDADGKVVAMTGQKGLMEYIADHFPRRIKVQMMSSKMHLNTREGA